MVEISFIEVDNSPEISSRGSYCSLIISATGCVPCPDPHLVFLWQLCICGFSVATGAASRLISGYDSYGNTCGQKNSRIPGIELSGRDHRSRKCVRTSGNTAL